MNRKNETKLIIFIGPAALVTFAVLALIIQLLRPPQISKELLESVNFKESLSERVKRLTGWDLTYSSLEATADLRFSMTDVTLSRANNGTTLHACQSGSVAGQFTNEGQLFSLSSLRVDTLSCQTTVDQDFRPIDLIDQVMPGISDFDLLFGLSLADARIPTIDLQITRLSSNGSVLDQVHLSDASAALGFSVSLSRQTAHLKLEANSPGVLFQRQDSSTKTMARISGDLSAQYDSSSGVTGSLTAALIDQDFIPSFRAEQFPALIRMAFEGKGRFPSALEVTGLDASIDGVARITAEAAQFSVSDANGELHFKLAGLEGGTEPRFAELIALGETAQRTQIARVRSGGLEGRLQFVGIVPAAHATLWFESMEVEVEPGAPLTLAGVKLSGQVSAADGRANVLAVSIDATGQEAQYLTNGFEAQNILLSARAKVHGDTRLDIESLTLRSMGHATDLEASGSIEWVDGLPQIRILKGEVNQSLPISLFDTYSVDAKARVPFDIRTRPDGSVAAQLDLYAEIPRVTTDTFVARDANVHVPVAVNLRAGLPADLLYKESVDQILDALTHSISQWQASLSGSIDQIEIIQDPNDADNNIVLNGVSLRGRLSQRGWYVMDTEAEGKVSLTSYSAPSLDGRKRKTYGYPTSVKWEFAPVSSSIPGVRISAEQNNTDTKQTLTASALLYPEDQTGLVIKYQTPSDILRHLAAAAEMDTLVNVQNVNVNGELRLTEFFSPASFEGWSMLKANIPYQGRSMGRATIEAKAANVSRVAQTERFELDAPRITIEHSGTSDRQDFTVIASSHELSAVLDNGNHYRASEAAARVEGSLDLPFPSRAITLRGELVTGRVLSVNTDTLEIPDTDFSFVGTILDGKSLNVGRATGRIGGVKVAELQGRIDSFHPLRGVAISGELRPHLPALPLEQLAGRFGNNASAQIPFQLTSNDRDELVAKGQLSIQGLNFQTPNQLVRNVSAHVPFALILKVHPDNSLVLQEDPQIYSERGLTHSGLVTLEASPLPRSLRDRETAHETKSNGRVSWGLAEHWLQLETALIGNRIVIRSRAHRPALFLGNGQPQRGFDAAEIILDERGIVFEADGQQFLVTEPLLGSTY